MDFCFKRRCYYCPFIPCVKFRQMHPEAPKRGIISWDRYYIPGVSPSGRTYLNTASGYFICVSGSNKDWCSAAAPADVQLGMDACQRYRGSRTGFYYFLRVSRKRGMDTGPACGDKPCL